MRCFVDNGCKWRALTHEGVAVFSADQTGLWDNILQHLVEVTRRRAGRNPNPTYAIIDSQSAAYKSEQVGYDGGKKGHKRYD